MVKRKLPSVYANKIDKRLNNCQTTYYVDRDESRNNNIKSGYKFKKEDVHSKINNMFRSSNYIYKVDVVITTEKGSFDKRIIGRNKTSLIDIDGDVIPINSIIEIEKK